MIKEVLTVTALLWGVTVSNANAEQRLEHYQALPAESLEQAVSNLNQYNQELAALTSQNQLSDEDMVKIHELTYTLETALQRLQTELEGTAQALEEVHLGSETMDQSRVVENARRYLQSMNWILQ